MKIKIKNLPFEEELIGKEEDNDQLFHQMGFSNSVVANGVITLDNEEYTFEIVCEGEQRVYANSKNETLMPTGDEDGECFRILNDSETLLEAMRLEKATGIQYLDWQNNCWLDIELSGDSKKGSYYDCFGSVYGSIKECLDALSEQNIKELFE